MTPTELHYRATLDPAIIQARMLQFLVPGPIHDRDLDNRIARLEESFHRYSALAPFGLWAPGLAVTAEMRAYTEAHLPLAQIAGAFRQLFTLSLHVPPFLPASPLQTAACWLDLLHAMQSLVEEANPARLLRLLLHDGAFRTRFLFAFFLPVRYGNGFARYPAQAEFLGNWLMDNDRGVLRCLDAACGSGEGCYDLALLLRERGYPPESFRLQAVTIDPLELFAAAHGWFPHDPCRQERFRLVRENLAESVCARIIFSLGDLCSGGVGEEESYDVILCNGFLGGPFLHDREALADVVARLCAQLRPGGILLAADRFHGGWKRLVPEEKIREILVENGLTPVAVQEGIGGKK